MELHTLSPSGWSQVTMREKFGQILKWGVDDSPDAGDFATAPSLLLRWSALATGLLVASLVYFSPDFLPLTSETNAVVAPKKQPPARIFIPPPVRVPSVRTPVLATAPPLQPPEIEPVMPKLPALAVTNFRLPERPRARPHQNAEAPNSSLGHPAQ